MDACPGSATRHGPGTPARAVYRYFRSKEELIDATADEGITRVQVILVRLPADTPIPCPAQTMGILVDELRSRTNRPDYDLSKLALQTWAEAMRRPSLRDRTRDLYDGTHAHITELTTRWRDEGHLPPDADPHATAGAVFTLMHGLIVCHHLPDHDEECALRGIATTGLHADTGA